MDVTPQGKEAHEHLRTTASDEMIILGAADGR